MSANVAAPEHAAAQLLYKARTALRLTQRQMAAAAGVPLTTLSAWETGRTIPPVDRLLTVLTAAGVTVELTASAGGRPIGTVTTTGGTA